MWRWPFQLVLITGTGDKADEIQLKKQVREGKRCMEGVGGGCKVTLG